MKHHGRRVGLKVVDNEGRGTYDSAELALYPSILGDANSTGEVDVRQKPND